MKNYFFHLLYNLSFGFWAYLLLNFVGSFNDRKSLTIAYIFWLTKTYIDIENDKLKNNK